MKLCMMSYTMARRADLFSVRATLDLAKELGLTGIDWCGLYDHSPEELGLMTKEYGLTAACYTFGADLNHPDAAGRQAGVDTVKRGIEAAVKMGTDKIMIPSPGKADVPRELTRRNFIAGLQEAADFAHQAGITITVENFPGAFSPFVLADDLLEAVHAVSGLKITYDNGNAATGEEPADSSTRCAEHVVHAHFKDWDLLPAGEGMRGLDGRYYRGGLIGEAILDHRSCLAAMQQAGYTGFINIEYEGNVYTPEQATRKAAAYLSGLMADHGITAPVI